MRASSCWWLLSAALRLEAAATWLRHPAAEPVAAASCRRAFGCGFTALGAEGNKRRDGETNHRTLRRPVLRPIGRGVLNVIWRGSFPSHFWPQHSLVELPRPRLSPGFGFQRQVLKQPLHASTAIFDAVSIEARRNVNCRGDNSSGP